MFKAVHTKPLSHIKPGSYFDASTCLKCSSWAERQRAQNVFLFIFGLKKWKPKLPDDLTTFRREIKITEYVSERTCDSHKKKKKMLEDNEPFCPPGLLFGIPVCVISCFRNSVLPFSQNKTWTLSSGRGIISQWFSLFKSLFCVWSEMFSEPASFSCPPPTHPPTLKGQMWY